MQIVRVEEVLEGEEVDVRERKGQRHRPKRRKDREGGPDRSGFRNGACHPPRNDRGPLTFRPGVERQPLFSPQPRREADAEDSEIDVRDSGVLFLISSGSHGSHVRCPPPPPPPSTSRRSCSRSLPSKPSWCSRERGSSSA